MRFTTCLRIVLLLVLTSPEVTRGDDGTLLGSRLTYGSRQQVSAFSDVIETVESANPIVTSLDVELPEIARLFGTDGILPNEFQVNLSYDIGDTYIEIDFSEVFFDGTFSARFLNAAVLSFSAPRDLEIVGASVDTSVSTLGLTADRIAFDGNELEINWQALAFDSSSFVRIDLELFQAPPPIAPFADFDNDDDVDIDDVNNLIDLFRQEPEGNLNDFDLDDSGAIDEGDLSLVIETLVETSNGQVGTFLGDFDLNGQVNVLGDAFTLVGNLGTNVDSYADGDANGDRQVDVLNDAFVLVGNLGRNNSME